MSGSGHWRVFSAFLLLTAVVYAPVALGDEGSAKDFAQSTIKDLAQSLAANKQSNLVQIDGILTEYTQEVPDPNSPPRARIDFSVTLDPLGGQAIRYDVKSMKREWTDGLSKIYESSELFTYNGRYWTQAVLREGAEGKTFESKRAIISSEVSDFFSHQRFETLEAFLLGRARNAKGDGLLRDDLLSGRFRSAVSVNLKDGTNAVQFRSRDECTEEELTLDPQRGYALVAYEITRNLCNPGNKPNHDVSKEIYTVGETTSVAGIAVPKQAIRKFLVNNKLRMWEQISVSQVKLLPPTAAKEAFRFDIPVNWNVTDSRFGLNFRVGPNPDALINSSKQTAPR